MTGTHTAAQLSARAGMTVQQLEAQVAAAGKRPSSPNRATRRAIKKAGKRRGGGR